MRLWYGSQEVPFLMPRVTRFVLFGIIAIVMAPAVAQAAPRSEPAIGSIVPGRYIVTVADGARPAAVARGRGVMPKAVMTHAINGFVATLTPAQVAVLNADPNVNSIEPDRVVGITATQEGATWGLDRIDQAALPLNEKYVYNFLGTGVTAYIIDTGIRPDHEEFVGRVNAGYPGLIAGDTNDCNGHGTHVAGTVGGTTYGVAKRVTLIPVRVLNCAGSGTLSGVIAGINWVIGNHADGAPAVANMSLGGGASTALDTAVANAFNDGVTVVVAAGNSNADACRYSPARAPTAITVGATTSTDARASYSNYGSCLDIFAPGTAITSAWYTTTTLTNTISGTSMAAPHVAGVAALLLQTTTTLAWTPARIWDQLRAQATLNKVTRPGRNSPNLLLKSIAS